MFARIAHSETFRRGGVTGITARGDADVTLVRAHPVRDVETDPPKTIDMGFCPSVGRVLINAVIHHQIAAHITRGQTCRARRGDKDLRMILTNARTTRHRLLGCGFRVGDADLVRDRL